MRLLKSLQETLSIRKIIVDPSAASFIEVIRRHDRFMVEQASNRVLDGIRDVANRLNAGDIFFCDCCTDCIREFGLYRWDEKAAEDRPLKPTTTLWTIRDISSAPRSSRRDSVFKEVR